MKILIIGLNYAPEIVGIGPYTTRTAAALRSAGHEVRVIAGKPYYPEWRANPSFSGSIYYRSIEDGIPVTRCPHYVPANPGGIRRIIHHASFAASCLWPAVRLARSFKPDLVLTVAPSLIAVPIARLAARISGAKLWLHVQDFEVEAAIATGLLSGGGKIGQLAQKFEAMQLQSADRVSTISPQMGAKLASKGVPRERIVEFRNWADVEHIRPLDRPSRYLREWGIETEHVALYSGNIANKQGLEIVIEAAEILRRRTDLTFVICGQGPNRANLESLAAKLPNVQVHGLQPVERLEELLGLATVHLLPQVVGAADLVLPSKLANMLASGRPVVGTAAEGTGLCDEIRECGIATPPGDAKALAAAIERLLADPLLRKTLGDNGRYRAVERWSSDALLPRFVAIVGQLMSGEKP